MRLVMQRPPSAWERLRNQECAASFIAGVAVGEAGAYFLDRERGHRRRRELVDRVAATGRRTSRHGGRALRHAVARAAGRGKGFVHRLRPVSRAAVDDTELAHKVESIVFRNERFPKGRISVNAERGEVFLRGELERPELIAELVEAVRRVPGVRSVANLLHLPGTPAPASVTAIRV